jgi:F-type H+-transporting ATPase subunit b
MMVRRTLLLSAAALVLMAGAALAQDEQPKDRIEDRIEDSVDQRVQEGGHGADHAAAGHGEAHGEHGGGHGAHHPAAEPHPINWYEWHYGKDILGGELDPGEEPMPPGILFALLNFAVFAGLLVKFAGPKLVGYLRTRHDTVKGQLDEAARLRAEARAKLDEYNRRIAGLDQEVSKLMHEILAEGEAERDAILAQARSQAEAMKREARARIENEIARARLALEREVVSAAVAAAEKVLRERTTPDDQARLFDSFIANLVAQGSGGPEGGGGTSGPGRRKRRGTVDEEWG